MRRGGSKVLGCAVAAALLAGACSSSKSGSTTTTTVKYDASLGVESPAAALRAELTDVLSGHVLLIGITADAQLAGEPTGPATAVLDQSSAALAAVITRFYGPASGADVLALWKRHTAALVDFASVAAPSTDKATVDAAKAAITSISGELTTLLNTINVQLTPEVLTARLATYTAGVEGAITAQAKQDPGAATKLKTAADAMTAMAIDMTAAIIKQKPKEVPGKLDAISAVLRTALAAKLSEHTYLAGIVTGTTLSGGDATSATAALDANSQELSEAIGGVYGDDAGLQFLKLWRHHISLFEDFTKAAGLGDTSGQATARSALDAYAGTFASFLAGADPDLSKPEVTQNLRGHIDSLLAAIEAQAAKDPGQVGKLRDAAMHMPGTALLLATGIAHQFPTKFG